MFTTRSRLAIWVLALGVTGSVGALASLRVRSAADAEEEVMRVLALERLVGDALACLTDAEAGQRGYLLTGDVAFLAPYETARDTLDGLLEALRSAALDEAQLEHARRMDELAVVRLERLEKTLNLFRTGHRDEALAAVQGGAGRRLMEAIRTEAQAMLDWSALELAERKQAAAAHRQRLLNLLDGAVAAFVALGAIGIWYAYRGLQEARLAAWKLHESERSYRSLADNANDLVRVIGTNGKLEYASPSCVDVLGYTEAEMLAMPQRALLPESERDQARQLVEAALAGRSGDEPFIHRMYRKDGSLRWFETKYRVVSEPDVEGVRIQLTSRDISERKAAEEALRKQTQRLESVLSNMGDGVVVADETRSMLLVNPVARRYIRQAIGAPITGDWVDLHRARELDGVTPYKPERGPLTLALNGHSVDELGLILHDVDGQPRAFSVTARPMFDGAQTAGCVAVYRDITEQRRAKQELEESEQRQRVLAEASFEGVAISRGGMLIDCNSTFATWFGHSPQSILGVDGLSLFAPEDREHVQRQSNVFGVVYEARMLRPNGSAFHVEVRGKQARVHGEPVRIAVIRDVTEIKRQQAELVRQADLLKSLSLRDELTGLYNRRGFMELGSQELRTATRGHQFATVLFIDLNDMKVVNDSMGHEMGDRLLVTAARVLRGFFRSSDVVSRLGGDEFAVLALGSGVTDASALRQRLHRYVAEFNSKLDAPFRLSFSIGVSIFSPTAGAELEALLEAADKDMYEDKRRIKALRDAEKELCG